MTPGPAERAPTAPAPLAPALSGRSGASWRPVILLILAVTAARLLYLAFLCPYTLVEDEAHYWEWSRRLAWSYYSKGPGIAWTIGATDWLAARLGIPVSEFTVRAAAPLFGGLLALAGAGLARSMQAFGSDREPAAARTPVNVPLLSAVLILLIPAYQVAALLMTIDGPYLACWGLAAWAGFNALHRRCGGAWLALGAALGAGFLYKYTILLLPVGIALYAILARPALRPHRRWPAFAAAGAALFALGLIPVIIWNAQHGWPTVHHLLGHLGVRGGDTAVTQGGDKGWKFSIEWPLVFLGTQVAMVGPVIALMIGRTRAAIAGRDAEPATGAGSPAAMYCTLCAAPILVFYLLVSFITEPEGNWPLAGYITLVPLVAMTIGHAAGRRFGPGATRPWWLQPPGGAGGPLLWFRLTLIVGLICGVGVLRLDLLHASAPSRAVQRLLQSVGVIKEDRPLIPIGRLLAAREVAQDAARVAAEIERDTGRRPPIIAQQYGRASQLAFYMPGRPTVYCSSAKSDGRRTQYDLWPDTDLDDPALLGRDALCIGGQLYQWQPAFDRVVEIGQLRGEPKKSRLSFIGYNYRGFPPSGWAPPPSTEHPP